MGRGGPVTGGSAPDGPAPGGSPDAPRPGGVPAPDALPPGEDPLDEAGPIGPFPTWGALYATVVVWALGLVVLLYLFGVFLNAPVAGP